MRWWWTRWKTWLAKAICPPCERNRLENTSTSSKKWRNNVLESNVIKITWNIYLCWGLLPPIALRYVERALHVLPCQILGDRDFLTSWQRLTWWRASWLSKKEGLYCGTCLCWHLISSHSHWLSMFGCSRYPIWASTRGSRAVQISLLTFYVALISWKRLIYRRYHRSSLTTSTQT